MSRNLSTHCFKKLLCLCYLSCFFLSGLPKAQTKINPGLSLPDLGTGSHGRMIDHAPLRRMGDNAWMHLQKESAWFEDPVVIHYLTHLVQTLAQHSPTPVNIRGIGVLNDSTINAFAMPGGFIVIHTGLLLKAETEDELASVLAHEIAHLSQAHIDQLWETQEKSQWGMLAAVLLGIYSGSTGNINTANALIASGIGAGQQQQIRHSQQAETEADDIGLDILTAAGFNPMGSVRMMDLLGRQRTEDVNSRYFATHPLTSERVRRLRDRTLGMWNNPISNAQSTNPQTLISFSEVQNYTRALLAQQDNPALHEDSCQNTNASVSFLATWQNAQCLLQNPGTSNPTEHFRESAREQLSVEQRLKDYFLQTPSFLIAQPLTLLLKQHGKTQEALKIAHQTIQAETQTGQLLTQAQSWWLLAQLSDESPSTQRLALTRSYLSRLECTAAQEQLKMLKQTAQNSRKNSNEPPVIQAQINADLNSIEQQIKLQCTKN